MIWLGLLVLVIGLFIWLRRRAGNEADQRDVPAACPTAVLPPPGEDDGELLAVLAAAIAEFEGSDDFTVVRIRTGGRNWALTARQELVHGRL